MTFKITVLYAIPLALLCLVLWFRISSMRANMKVSIGDAGSVDLHERIRQHGNFIEWVPFVLVLMMLAESSGVGSTWLHAAGALLLVGRLLHPFGLKAAAPAHPLRIVGNSANLIATLVLVGCLVVTQFR